ncbi:MAG: PIN domain-containing protein [Pseudomonadota bacterium]|nr:PIN domain-containing protein [Pseudomonadota bacterium]
MDTSVAADFLQGVASPHVQLLQDKMTSDQVCMAAVVITELLSNPTSPRLLQEFLHEVTPLEIETGYWERAGKNRAKLKAMKLKAKTADALIAQSCIDHDVPLLTRDPDFRHYAKLCGLKLAIISAAGKK